MSDLATGMMLGTVMNDNCTDSDKILAINLCMTKETKDQQRQCLLEVKRQSVHDNNLQLAFALWVFFIIAFSIIAKRYFFK